MKLRSPIETLYVLGKVLHKDTLTTVCIAKHKQTGRDRVLKQVKKSKPTKKSDTNAEMLSREVNTLSRLDHPNILKLYELYEDKQYFYFISEALTGGYLMDYLTMERNLSEQLAAKIIKQVLKALAYCHSRGILHGNLSMESLILQSAPTDGNVHVVVLGIGSVCLQQDRERLRGKSSFYVAPETLRNAQTEKTDVWSSGVILHLLLCGNPPFNGPTPDSILEHIGDESNVTFPQELWDGVSAEAINLLRGMLVKDPSARISVAECLNHPWIKANSKCTSADSKRILPALRNLKMFNAKTSLKHIILSFISAHVDIQEETKALK
jgi:calcium-dependent protein kinase